MNIHTLQLLAIVIVTLVSLITTVKSDEDDHKYKVNDDVTLWFIKLGPYHNPQETYKYDKLPWCSPPPLEPVTKDSGLGDILNGNDYVNSGIEIHYLENIKDRPLCHFTMDEKNAESMSFAVANHYWYQMQLDELPIWGFVGSVAADDEVLEAMELDKVHPHTVLKDAAFMFTHYNITILYNEDRIIEALFENDNFIKITSGEDIAMTYDVTWVSTTMQFQNRFDKFLDYSFFEHQVHWFSIFNSFMMVFFLVVLVVLILMGILKKDFARYQRDDEDMDAFDRGLGDDSGWKQIHGDVFRKPDRAELYVALIGTGAQLTLLCLFMIILSFVISMYTYSGGFMNVGIFSYAFTSFVSGYVSGGLYNQYYYPKKAPGWIKAMVYTCSIFPLTIFAMCFLLNFISVYYGTQNAIPVGTMVFMFFLWAGISVPLTVAGTIVGRNWYGRRDIPCRVNSIPKGIPPSKWYFSQPFTALVSGIIPFGCVCIEVYFIFTSFWNYKVYYVYGFMLLVLVIVSIVIVCESIVTTYLKLSNENYLWNWDSFINSSSTAGYVFLYSVYYFFVKTNMTGFLQTCFYFGYMALFCLGLAILTGTIGNRGTALFVRSIYQNIKVD